MQTTTERTDRHQIVAYRTYPEAQRAVDELAAAGFPVEHLSIEAEHLRFVEDVTGRRGYAEAAFGGLVAGGPAGALVGFFFGLLSWIDPLVSGIALAGYGFLLGSLIGIVMGLSGRWLTGQRGFSSVGYLQAGRYIVVADGEETAERALRELPRRA